MIGRRKSDKIDIFPVQDLSEISVPVDFLTSTIALLDFLFQDVFVDIAQGDEAHALHFSQLIDVVLSAAAKADYGIAEFFTGVSGTSGLCPPGRKRGETKAAQH